MVVPTHFLARRARACCAALALALGLPAAAQLKLPGNGPPSPGGRGLSAPSLPSAPSVPPSSPASPAPAAPSAPAAAPARPASAPQASAVEDKKKAGQLAAAGWLTLLDRGDWGTAWETSARIFRTDVPLPQWLEGAPRTRAEFGQLIERKPTGVSYDTRLEGMPPGEYVSVAFTSRFEKKEVDEVVTTVLEPGGRWRVTGYSTR